MRAVGVPRGGARRDHDVARDAVAIRGQGDKVSSLAFRWTDGDELFRISVPSPPCGTVGSMCLEYDCVAGDWDPEHT